MIKIAPLIFALFSISHAQNFDWVLESKISNSNSLVHDKRIHGLLRKIIPDIKVKRNVEPTLPGVVRADIMLPGDKQIESDRYVYFEGARPHDASTAGLLWLDLRKKIGAFAIRECPVKKKRTKDCAALIGSNFFKHNKLPEHFKKTLAKWIKQLNQYGGGQFTPILNEKNIKFIGKDKKIQIPILK